MIAWEQAQIHVMSHVIHYGSSVFEGLRCYARPDGAGIFRLQEHMQRLLDSAKIYRMPLGYNARELWPQCRSRRSQWRAPCYIRPIAFRGYGEIGVNPLKAPVEVYIANFPWGKYVPGNDGADVCISSWNRLAPNTMPSLAKAGANYMNSQLIRMEAEINGYSEGIALDTNGYLSEGLRREPLPDPRRSALHHAAGQLGAERNYARTPYSPSPRRSIYPSSSSRCRVRCSTSATKRSSPEPPPKSLTFAPSTAFSSAMERWAP